MGLTFYIGFMACGKSTLGQKHAAASGKNFVDLDREFSRETGMTPEKYITEKGEESFRREEKKLLRKVVAHWMASGKPGQLVACGGGTPCFFDNLEFMKTHGHVVFIDTPLETLLERIRREPDRWPAAKSYPPEKLYEERRKWYEQAHERLIP